MLRAETLRMGHLTTAFRRRPLDVHGATLRFSIAVARAADRG
jgi:hypothetical protein